MFREIKPNDLTKNVFDAIGKQWMLITAQKDDRVNTMTASWGGMGIMWNKPVAFLVVRPTRFTYPMLQSAERCSLNFLGEEHRDILNFCGKYSGRDMDKLQKTGLTVLSDCSAPYFAQSETVMICKKLYTQMFDAESFVDPAFGEQMYADKNFHRLFICEIEKVLIR